MTDRKGTAANMRPRRAGSDGARLDRANLHGRDTTGGVAVVPEAGRDRPKSRTAGTGASTAAATRSQSADALQDSDDTYRLLVQGVRDYAIVMLDPQGEIVSWNPGAERMTGRMSSEALGHNFSLFYTAEDIKWGKPGRILRQTTENGMHDEEGWRVRKDGSRFLVRTTFTVLHDEVGKPARVRCDQPRPERDVGL